MAARDIARAKKLLTSLLEEKGLDITHIVLFGSATRHENRESSDLDLIVVSKDFSGQDIFARVERTRGIHRKMVKTLRRPIDLMFFSDEEWLNSSASIIEAARTEGRIL